MSLWNVINLLLLSPQNRHEHCETLRFENLLEILTRRNILTNSSYEADNEFQLEDTLRLIGILL